MFYGTSVWDPALIIAQARPTARAAGCFSRQHRAEGGVTGAAALRDERRGADTRALSRRAPRADHRHPGAVLHQPGLPAARVAGCVLCSRVRDAVLQTQTTESLTRLRALCCAALRCAAGPVAPQLSLFYFFDYSALSMHSFMGWCAARAQHGARHRPRPERVTLDA
jgi:hypothetical protein